jgi:hypothetical protein
MTREASDYAHLVRMAGLFVIGVTAFVVLRWLMVPADFGLLGHYRAGAVTDNMKPSPVFAGQAACVECHADVAELRAKGRHAGVACEACHGALAAHASNPDGQKSVRPDSRNTCISCHSANISKPASFPQVVPAEHAPDGSCAACHVVHNPKIS